MIRWKSIVKYENTKINRHKIVASVDITKISRRKVFSVYNTFLVIYFLYKGIVLFFGHEEGLSSVYSFANV